MLGKCSQSFARFNPRPLQAKGTTCPRKYTGLSVTCFNPRPHMGDDNFPTSGVTLTVISIHASTKEAT